LKSLKKISLFLFLCLTGSYAYAQQTVISGKVTDAASGEAVPYAKVYFKHLHMGTSTSFEGFYKISAANVEDSLTVDYLGYASKSKPVKKGQVQVINFQLESSEMQIDQVVIRPGENPAWRIIRGVWAHKAQNDKVSLSAYQYKGYTKIGVSANNISDSFKKSALMRPFRNVFDSLKLIAGDDGKTLLPFFISETMSDIYYLKTPELKSEHIRASKLSGVGLKDGSLASQLVGSSLQDYNFYNNWINIIDRGFVSPIADGGLGFYRYYLIDSVTIDGKYCYKIEFKPRHEKDLAFSGTMWINDTTFALKRIIVEVGKTSNLNYIKSLHIQQDLMQTSAGAWLPAKERITVDISEIAGKTFGILGKLYVSNSDFVVNKPLKLPDYENRLTQDDEALYRDKKYWAQNRPDSLTKEDLTVLHIIDTIRSMPNIKTAVDIADVIVNGYYTVGKIDIGPYILLLGQDVAQGYRFRVGFRTNEDFSRLWVLKGYAAVGTKDWNSDKLKFSLSAEHFLSRKSWTKIGAQYQYDIQGLGVADDFFGGDNLLTASAQLGLLTRLNLVRQSRVWFESDIVKGFNVRVSFLRKSLSPRGDYNFAYFPDPSATTDPTALQKDIHVTEAEIDARMAFKETYIINGNRRLGVGFDKAPIFTLQYAHGFKGILDGGFNYDRLTLGIEQTAKMGTFGHADYLVSATKVFATLPYPLLNILPGNETIFRTYSTFNMMGFFEFATDQSLQVFYTQHFDGIFFNRVPLLKKLKWREVVGIKGIWGGISPQNDINNPGSLQYPHYPIDNPLTKFYTLDPNKPYVEVSYGVENIFRFFRIDFLQRLDYLSIRPNVAQFGVKGSFYFAF
jgi:hypothetical protein